MPENTRGCIEPEQFRERAFNNLDKRITALSDRLCAIENSFNQPSLDNLKVLKDQLLNEFINGNHPGKIMPSKDRADEICLFALADGTGIGLDENMIVMFEQDGQRITIPWGAMMAAIQRMRNSKDAYLKSKRQGE